MVLELNRRRETKILILLELAEELLTLSDDALAHLPSLLFRYSLNYFVVICKQLKNTKYFILINYTYTLFLAKVSVTCY